MLRAPAALRAFLRQRGALLFSAVIVALFLAAAFAGRISPHDPAAVDLGARYRPPSGDHPFGTDSLGRDVLSRTLHGARISISIGVLSRGAALAVGVAAGLAAGTLGGRTDWVVMRLVDSTLAFPSLLLAIGVAFFIGQGYATLLISLTVVSWAPIARLVRSQALRLREQPFVEAARAYNDSTLRIVLLHILPNCASIIIVAATSGIAAAILGESSLSFLGLGPDPSVPTWGQMIASGLKDVFAPPPGHPWIYLFPGAFLFLTVLSFNVVGDLVRDALDPRLRGRR